MKVLTLIQIISVCLTPAMAFGEDCLRPKDFSNREEAAKYDACVMKNGYKKPTQDPAASQKASCLHVEKGVVACREKELRGESIKPVEVAVVGTSPTPKPEFKQIDGSVQVDDSYDKQKKESKEGQGKPAESGDSQEAPPPPAMPPPNQ